jgi:PTH2 family peptidyl-tRNA hydrolase
MKDYDSAEAREERATQEDPIVMYLIVHESLNMSIGKTAAQSAHASQMLTLKYFTMKEASITLQKRMQPLLNAPPQGDEMAKLKTAYAELSRPLSIFGEWLNSSFRKVVLRASDKEWAKLKEEFKDSMVMVVDAGLTEIAAGSETFIGLWPVRKSQVSKTVKRLQVLK